MICVDVLSTGGADTVSTDGTFDISNLDRLGSSEVDQIHIVIDGVNKLIEMEKALEQVKMGDYKIELQFSRNIVMWIGFKGIWPKRKQTDI